MHLTSRTASCLRLLCLLALAGACTPSVPDGTFVCTGDADCPQGLRCRQEDGLCYRGMRPEATRATPAMGFRVLGAARSNGSVTLSDERLEQGARACTPSGSVCVVGGFVP